MDKIKQLIEIFIWSNKKYIDEDEYDFWVWEVTDLIELYEEKIIPTLKAVSIIYKKLCNNESFEKIVDYINNLNPESISLDSLISLAGNCAQRGPLFFVYCTIEYYGGDEFTTKDYLQEMIESTFYDGAIISDLLEVILLWEPDYFQDLGPVLSACKKKYPRFTLELRNQYVEQTHLVLK